MVLNRGMVPLAITIKPVSWPGDEGPAAAFLDLEIFTPDGIDERQLRDDLIAMTGLRENYLITERHSITEWGASAEGYEVALTIISSAWAGIVGGAAWDFLKHTVQKTGQAVGKPPLTLSDEEIQRVARQRVVRRYDCGDWNDLKVLETRTGTTSDGFEWSVTLQAPAGTKYVVECRANNAFSMTRIERSV